MILFLGVLVVNVWHIKTKIQWLVFCAVSWAHSNSSQLRLESESEAGWPTWDTNVTQTETSEKCGLTWTFPGHQTGGWRLFWSQTRRCQTVQNKLWSWSDDGSKLWLPQWTHASLNRNKRLISSTLHEGRVNVKCERMWAHVLSQGWLGITLGAKAQTNIQRMYKPCSPLFVKAAAHAPDEKLDKIVTYLILRNVCLHSWDDSFFL